MHSKTILFVLILSLCIMSGYTHAQNKNLQFKIPIGHGPNDFITEFDKSANDRFMVTGDGQNIVFWDYENVFQLNSLLLSRAYRSSISNLALLEKDTLVYFEYDKPYLWKPMEGDFDTLSYIRRYDVDNSFIEIRPKENSFELWHYESHSASGELFFKRPGKPLYRYIKYELGNIIVVYLTSEEEAEMDLINSRSLGQVRTLPKSVIEKIVYKWGSASSIWTSNLFCFDQGFNSLYVNISLDTLAIINQEDGSVEEIRTGFHTSYLQPRTNGVIAHDGHGKTYLLNDKLDEERIVDVGGRGQVYPKYYEENGQLIYSQVSNGLNAIESNGLKKEFKGFKTFLNGINLIDNDSFLIRSYRNGHALLNLKSNSIKEVSNYLLVDSPYDDKDRLDHITEARPYYIKYGGGWSEQDGIKVVDIESDSIVWQYDPNNLKPFLSSEEWDSKFYDGPDNENLTRTQSFVHWDPGSKTFFLATQKKIFVINNSKELKEYQIPRRNALIGYYPNLRSDIDEEYEYELDPNFYYQDSAEVMITKIVTYNARDSLLLCEGILQKIEGRFGGLLSPDDIWDWDNVRVSSEIAPIIIKVTATHLELLSTDGLDGVNRIKPEFGNLDGFSVDYNDNETYEKMTGASKNLLFEKFLSKDLAVSKNKTNDSLFIWSTKNGKIVRQLQFDYYQLYRNGYYGSISRERYDISPDLNKLVVIKDGEIAINNLQNKQSLKVAILNGDSFIAYTSLDSFRFDASPGIDKYVYFQDGHDFIGFDQLKDRYFEPGFVQKVLGYSKEPLRKSRGLGSIDLYPGIELQHPAQNKGKLGISLKNQGGGYGPVKLSINGKEVTRDIRATSFDHALDSVYLTYVIKNHPFLKQGELNIIEVSAYNQGEYLVSRPKKLYYVPKGKKEDYSPTLHAIIVGTADYSGDQLDLSFPSKDATSIASALELSATNLLGVENTNFTVLTNDAESSNWPTKANIRQAYTQVAEVAKPYDALVLYFAGHGTNYGGQDGDFYYLTADASSGNLKDPVVRQNVAISSNELTDWIKEISALKQVLIFDACHSGQFAEDLMVKRDIRSSSEIRSLERMKDRTGMYILSGSAADAVSYEASIYGQGLLTYSLLFGMKGAALREDKFVDVVELFQYAADKVPELAESIGGIQKPEVRMPYGGESFDLGLLASADREKIVLSSPKPLFVRSSFQNQATFDDDLELTDKMNELLKAEQLEKDNLIFIDASKFSNAYSIRGAYTRNGADIGLRANLILNGEIIKSISDSSTSAQELIIRLLDQFNSAVKKKN